MNNLIILTESIGEGSYVPLEMGESVTHNGMAVLGIIRGPAFFPDGESRNERFYPKKVWEVALKDEELQTSMKERNCYGCIGHDVPLTDASYRSGLFSHIVTQLKFNENNSTEGVVEMAILDTPAGRILNATARAGCKIYVSTRALGKTEGKKRMPSGKTLDLVSPDGFRLLTVDVVLRPGFLKASPSLVEELQKDINIVKAHSKGVVLEEGANCMNESQDKLISELVEARTEARELTSLVEEQKAVIAKLTLERNTLLEAEEEKDAKVKELEDENKKLKAESEEDDKEKTDEEEEEDKETLKEFLKIASSPSELKTVLDMLEGLLDSYRVIGKPSEISEALNVMERKILEYHQIGEVSEVEAMKECFERMIVEAEEEKEQEKVEKLAKKFKVSEKVVEKLSKKFEDEDELEQVLSELQKSSFAEEFKDKEVEEEDDDIEGEKDDDDASDKKDGEVSESQVSRVMASTRSYKRK